MTASGNGDDVQPPQRHGPVVGRQVQLPSDWAFAVVDALIVVVAYSTAMVLRFRDADTVASAWWRSFLVLLPVIVVVHLVTTLLAGVYGHLSESAKVEAAIRLVWAGVLAGLVLVTGLSVWQQNNGGSKLVPLSVIVLGNALALCLMGAMRYGARRLAHR